eukprot:scaffold191_cov273-Chaetoceros_neogracile.AAC.50
MKQSTPADKNERKKSRNIHKNSKQETQGGTLKDLGGKPESKNAGRGGVSSRKQEQLSRRKPSLNAKKRSNKNSDESSETKEMTNAGLLHASADEYVPSMENLGEGQASEKEESEQGSKEIDKDLYQESFERASADLEILCAAYPEEIEIFQSGDEMSLPLWFPLLFILALPGSLSGSQATVTMEFPKGYPTKKLEVISFRTSPAMNKEYIEKVVSCIKVVATEAVETYEGEECGLQCCATAIECWDECLDQEKAQLPTEEVHVQDVESDDDIQWISAETTLLDRKSVFQAHVCIINSDEMVKRAVNKLIQGSSTIQRASHNMFAYRLVENLKDGQEVLKHDNDDDGEDAAGSRLALLLHMRKEDGVLVLVSRWYGGVKLGPKRFAHITNVAKDLLVKCHCENLLPNPPKE